MVSPSVAASERHRGQSAAADAIITSHAEPRASTRSWTIATVADAQFMRSGIRIVDFLGIAAFAVLWSGANLLSAVLAASAALFYVFVYTLWLKRTSRQNIVIGGAAGAVPVLVGWAAVRDSLDWAPVVLFAAIFFWTPPHFWALAIRHADEYRAAGVPMLPAVETLERTVRQMVLYTVVLVGVTLLMLPVSELGWIYGVAAAVLGALFLAGTVDLGRRPTTARSMRLFGFSITYVTLLFLAITVDVLVRHGW